VPLFPESRHQEQTTAAVVVFQTRRFDSMQPEFIESEVENEWDRLSHIALSGIILPHPVPERAHFGDPAADIRQGNAAQQFLVWPGSENQKAIPLVALPICGVLFEAAAERRSA